MIRYAKTTDYAFEKPHRTKLYQRVFMKEWLPKYVSASSRVLEVGADVNIGVLESLDAMERWIADPYEGEAGGKQRGLPEFEQEFRKIEGLS